MKYTNGELVKKCAEVLNELYDVGEKFCADVDSGKLSEEELFKRRVAFAELMGKAGIYLDHVADGMADGLRAQGYAIDDISKEKGKEYDKAVLKAMQAARVDIGCGCGQQYDADGQRLNQKGGGQSEMLAKLLGLSSAEWRSRS